MLKNATILFASLAIGMIVGILVSVYKRKKEGLSYLKIYDVQDHYKNRSQQGIAQWPVVNTSTTALAKIMRESTLF